MLYLKRFSLSDEDANWQNAAAAVNMYGLEESFPCGFFPRKQLYEIEFEPITFFYGNNGSGKTTLLNIIADRIRAQRNSIIHRSKAFEGYVGGCDTHLSRLGEEKLKSAKILTSNDIFEEIERARNNNLSVEEEKERLREIYREAKTAIIDRATDSSERISTILEARRKTRRKFVDANSSKKQRQYSNGENALLFFERELSEDNLYLLDEPENSMSPKYQLLLKKLLEDSARFFNCQFIVATHSPFLLSCKGARIYDLDTTPVEIKKWHELENVRAYYELFKNKSELFEENDD